MTTNKSSKKQPQNLTLIVTIVVVALVAAVVFIIFSMNNTGGSINDYEGIPQERLADGGFVLGDPDAPVTVVAFEDFLCPACQDYKPTVDRFIEEFVATGQARFEYRFFPTQGPNAIYAAQTAECADVQREGTFWRAHDELFAMASRGVRDERMSRELADNLDLNYSELLQCIRDDAEQYRIDQALGTRSQVSGTPAIRIRYGDSAPQIVPGFERGGMSFEALRNTVLGAAAISQAQ